MRSFYLTVVHQIIGFNVPVARFQTRNLKKGQEGSFLNFRFLAPKATVYMFRLQNNAENLKMVYGTQNM